MSSGALRKERVLAQRHPNGELSRTTTAAGDQDSRDCDHDGAHEDDESVHDHIVDNLQVVDQGLKLPRRARPDALPP
jgi:hypothetical protein